MFVKGFNVAPSGGSKSQFSISSVIKNEIKYILNVIICKQRNVNPDFATELSVWKMHVTFVEQLVSSFRAFFTLSRYYFWEQGIRSFSEITTCQNTLESYYKFS